MNSDIYFVLVGDHVFSASEMRRAYYSGDVVFAAANDCLSVSCATHTPFGLRMEPAPQAAKSGKVIFDQLERRRNSDMSCTRFWVRPSFFSPAQLPPM
jgi:hypothetical protein